MNVGWGGRYKNQTTSAVAARRAARHAYRANKELKFFDTTAAFNAGGVIVVGGEIDASMNLIVQGTGENERIGRKCVVKSIHIKGDVELPTLAGAGGGNFDRCRIIVYVDKQANGATAAVTDILQSADILSHRNLSNTGRFTVLQDQVWNVNQGPAAGDGGANDYTGKFLTWSMYKQLNLPIEFSAAAGALAELRSNNIGLLTITEQGVALAKYNCRLRFED